MWGFQQWEGQGPVAARPDAIRVEPAQRLIQFRFARRSQDRGFGPVRLARVALGTPRATGLKRWRHRLDLALVVVKVLGDEGSAEVSAD